MKSHEPFWRRVPRQLATVLFCFCAGAGGSSPAAELSMRGYYLEGFSAEKGLPQNSVTDLLQSQDGYLWVVTPFGLARFDGVTFKVFTSGTTPGLRENMFTAIVEDNEGVLWAGTRDGLLRYERGRFERLDMTAGLTATRIDGLSRRRQGGVWVAAGLSIAHVTGRRATTALTTRSSVRAVFEDSSERLWFCDDHAVYVRPPGTSQVERVLRGDREHEGRVSSFYDDGLGSIWFGTRYGLYRWRDGELNHFSLYGEDVPLRMEGDRAVRYVTKGPNPGDLWVALDQSEGLYLFRDGEWLKAGSPEWPELRRVRSCLEDVEGNLWLGTDSHGLLRLRYPRLQVISKEEGLPHDCVWSVSASRQGGIWAGGQEGVSRIATGDHAVAIPLPEHWRDAIIRSVVESKSGDLLLGNHLHGLYRFRNGTFDITPMEGFTKTVYEDRSGTVWVGTHEGMARVWAGKVRHYTTNDGLPHRDVRAFLEDRQGQLWIGTHGGGVCIFTNETFRRVDGLSSHKAWSFHEDPDGAIWISTAAGLNRYKNGRVFAFTREHGLFDDLVNCVVEDDAGTFWISCNRGIYRVSRRELNEVADGKRAQAGHVAYGEADGMLSSETNGEQQPAGCKSIDGRVWFPTQRGVVIINPKTVYRNELAPPVIIEQVRAKHGVVFGAEPEVIEARASEKPAPEPASGPHRLKPGEADVLEIRFTANSFVEPAKVRFRHRLEGHDSEWSAPHNSRIAHYTNLRPGKYRFRVIACNNHGYWNEQGDSFSFVVAPHFYETWSFYGLCALGLVTGAAGVQAFRLRLQRKMLHLQQQEALQRERERIARDMHDDLGANLTRIAILSEVAKHQAEHPDQVRNTAKTISETARRVVDNISEIVWLTNPKNDTLDSLAGYLRSYAAEFFDLSPLVCRLEFPEGIPHLPVPGDLRRDILLAFKEALNNAARHSQAREVTVTCALSDPEPNGRRFSLTIADDGKGLAGARVDATNNGLKNMCERLSRRGGSAEVSSRSGGGTCVQISVVFPDTPSTTFV